MSGANIGGFFRICPENGTTGVSGAFFNPFMLRALYTAVRIRLGGKIRLTVARQLQIFTGFTQYYPRRLLYNIAPEWLKSYLLFRKSVIFYMTESDCKKFGLVSDQFGKLLISVMDIE